MKFATATNALLLLSTPPTALSALGGSKSDEEAAKKRSLFLNDLPLATFPSSSYVKELPAVHYSTPAPTTDSGNAVTELPSFDLDDAVVGHPLVDISDDDDDVASPVLDPDDGVVTPPLTDHHDDGDSDSPLMNDDGDGDDANSPMMDTDDAVVAPPLIDNYDDAFDPALLSTDDGNVSPDDVDMDTQMLESDDSFGNSLASPPDDADSPNDDYVPNSTVQDADQRTIAVHRGCPAFSSVFDESKVGETVANWLTIDKTGGTSFLAGLYENYLTDDSKGPLAIYQGSELLDESSICSNLPLNATDCYLASNPDASFFEHLVANYIPLGNHVVNAIDTVEELVAEFQDILDEAKKQIFNSKDSGSCIVGNKKMVGMFESPGYPSPFIYNICNAISMVQSGTQACAVQPYFTGFAFSTGEPGSLVYDFQNIIPDGDVRLYDGFAEYNFRPSGDVFVSMDLGILFPQSKQPPSPTNLRSLVQSAISDTTKTDITLVSSMLVKDGKQGDPETLFALAIERLDVRLKLAKINFAEFNIGNAFGVLRSGGADQVCQPSGMFVKANVGSFFLGDALGDIMSGVFPEYEVNVGITLKEGALQGSALDSLDQVESVFFRTKAKAMSLLGVTIEDPHFEIQYFTESEAARRQEWSIDRCCQLPNVADPHTCGTDQTMLTDYLEGKLSGEKPLVENPTLAMLFHVPRISFVGGIVQFNDISVQYFAELPSNLGDQATSTLMLSCNAKILFIASIDASALFSVSVGSEGTSVQGSFDVSTTIDAGPIGKLHVMIDASADVSAFTYQKNSKNSRSLLSNESGERRLTISGGSLVDADWDLDVSIEFESEVLDAIVGAVSDAAKATVKAMEEAWDEVDEALGEAADAIEDLAEDIGEGVVDAINEVGDFVGDGIDEIEDFLDDVGDFAEDLVTNPGNLLSSIASGRIFGSSTKCKEHNRHLWKWVKTDRIDPETKCPMLVFRWIKRCKTCGWSCSSWRNSYQYKWDDLRSDPNCIKHLAHIKGAQTQVLKYKLDRSRARKDEKEESINSAKSLQWLAEGSATASELGVGVTTSRSLLKASDATEGSCQNIDVAVSAKHLLKDQNGVVSDDVGSELAATVCIDLTSENDIASSLSETITHQAANKVKDIVLQDNNAKPIKKHPSDHWNRYNYVLAGHDKCHEIVAEGEIEVESKVQCDSMGGSSTATGGWVRCKLNWCRSDTATKSGPAIVAAQRGTCSKKLAYGIIPNMVPAACDAMGGGYNAGHNGMVGCHLDWCDAEAGTTTGRSFIPGVVGSCDKKIGSGVHSMPATWCRFAGGSFPFDAGNNHDSVVGCQLDYCEVQTEKAIGTRPYTGADFDKCDWYHDADVCVATNGCSWNEGVCEKTWTETPAIVVAGDANLSVHAWRGFVKGGPLRLHREEEYAKQRVQAQYSFIDIGDGKVIICLQYVDLCWQNAGGPRESSEIKLSLGRQEAANNPDSQYRVFEHTNGRKIICATNVSLCVHNAGKTAEGHYLKLYGGISYARFYDYCQYRIKSHKLGPTTGIPTIIKASDANLFVHSWGGFHDLTFVRLHGNDYNAHRWANSQFRIVELGEGKINICFQYLDLCMCSWGGLVDGSYIRMHQSQHGAKTDPNSQFRIVDHPSNANVKMMCAANVDLCIHTWAGTADGHYLRMHGGLEYAKTHPNSQYELEFHDPGHGVSPY